MNDILAARILRRILLGTALLLGAWMLLLLLVGSVARASETASPPSTVGAAPDSASIPPAENTRAATPPQPVPVGPSADNEPAADLDSEPGADPKSEPAADPSPADTVDPEPTEEVRPEPESGTTPGGTAGTAVRGTATAQEAQPQEAPGGKAAAVGGLTASAPVVGAASPAIPASVAQSVLATVASAGKPGPSTLSGTGGHGEPSCDGGTLLAPRPPAASEAEGASATRIPPAALAHVAGRAMLSTGSAGLETAAGSAGLETAAGSADLPRSGHSEPGPGPLPVAPPVPAASLGVCGMSSASSGGDPHSLAFWLGGDAAASGADGAAPGESTWFGYPHGGTADPVITPD